MENNYGREIKSQSGITLIALVITIIVHSDKFLGICNCM